MVIPHDISGAKVWYRVILEGIFHNVFWGLGSASYHLLGWFQWELFSRGSSIWMLGTEMLMAGDRTFERYICIGGCSCFGWVLKLMFHTPEFYFLLAFENSLSACCPASSRWTLLFGGLNKLFLLQVALVMAFYHYNIKIANMIAILKIWVWSHMDFEKAIYKRGIHIRELCNVGETFNKIDTCQQASSHILSKFSFPYSFRIRTMHSINPNTPKNVK